MFRTHLLALALLTTLLAVSQTAPETTPPSPAAPLPDSRKLIVSKMVPAEYPADAVLQRLEGKVIVKVQISEAGDVESVEAVSGEKIFYAAATSAVRQWKFQPFIRDGRPSKVSTSLTVPFFLNDVLSVVPDGDASLVSEANGLRRVRVPARVAEAHLLQRVPAALPPFADAHVVFGTGLSGVVEVEAVIGKDGVVREVKELSGQPLLRRSAADAVRQYRYRPFVWKGQEVEAVAVVSVAFHR